jgi:hypothetical protein
MGRFTKDIKTMDDLFLHTLPDNIYYAENKIVKSLPEMIDTAHDCYDTDLPPRRPRDAAARNPPRGL